MSRRTVVSVREILQVSTVRHPVNGHCPVREILQVYTTRHPISGHSTV